MKLTLVLILFLTPLAGHAMHSNSGKNMKIKEFALEHYEHTFNSYVQLWVSFAQSDNYLSYIRFTQGALENTTRSNVHIPQARGYATVRQTSIAQHQELDKLYRAITEKKQQQKHLKCFDI
jgi:hypothetical protein